MLESKGIKSIQLPTKNVNRSDTLTSKFFESSSFLRKKLPRQLSGKLPSRRKFKQNTDSRSAEIVEKVASKSTIKINVGRRLPLKKWLVRGRMKNRRVITQCHGNVKRRCVLC